ncbi:MAG: glycosyltransferase [Chitinispirillaceae bacterium]|nr:glycosyltransferase [Chitinispirillaceae bacterium]
MPRQVVTSEGTLSVCMIVKNEADFLSRCLASVRPVADEIIVVDTGSQDRTVEAARSFAATVVTAEWHNNFAVARNISLDHATSTWILWLDADDVVPAKSLPLIAQLKKEPPGRVFGFIVRNQRPNDTGTEFVQARMFPNRPDIRFERRVHEQMMPSALRLGMKMEKREVVIEHHGYADPEILKRKARRNIGLMLEEYDHVRPDPVTAVEIGDSYQLIEEFEYAKKWYHTVLSIPDVARTSPAIASQAHTGLGNLFNRQEQYGQAVKHLNEAVVLTPWRTDALYAMAVAFELSGKPENAVMSLRRILAMKTEPGQVGVDFRAAAIKATLRLQRILVEQGRMQESKAETETALAAFPERPEIALMAGKVFSAAQDIMPALKLFEKSISLASDHPHIDSYIGLCLIYLKVNRAEVARKTLDSIEPLFGTTLRYRAFRRSFLEKNVGTPDGFSGEEMEKERGNIVREFFVGA